MQESQIKPHILFVMWKYFKGVAFLSGRKKKDIFFSIQQRQGRAKDIRLNACV